MLTSKIFTDEFYNLIIEFQKNELLSNKELFDTFWISATTIFQAKKRWRISLKIYKKILSIINKQWKK